MIGEIGGQVNTQLFSSPLFCIFTELLHIEPLDLSAATVTDLTLTHCQAEEDAAEWLIEKGDPEKPVSDDVFVLTFFFFAHPYH